MRKKHIVTWDMLHIYSKNLALCLYNKKKWKRIFSVNRRGLIPCLILSREFSIRYIDTICISSYNNINFKKI